MLIREDSISVAWSQPDSSLSEELILFCPFSFSLWLGLVSLLINDHYENTAQRPWWRSEPHCYGLFSPEDFTDVAKLALFLLWAALYSIVHSYESFKECLSAILVVFFPIYLDWSRELQPNRTYQLTGFWRANSVIWIKIVTWETLLQPK